MNRRDVATDFGIFTLAVAARLGMYAHFRPEGLEPDGVGFAAQFWHASETASAIPGWWSEVMSRVAGYWPPLYSTLIGIVATFTGDPFLAGRLVSAIAAGMCAILVARLAFALTEDRLAGAFAGLLVATTPLSIAWDVRVRPESLFLVFVVATVLAFRRVNLTPTPRNWSITIAFAGLAFFTKYEAIALLPPILWFGFRRGTTLKTIHRWELWVSLSPWVAGLAWMLTHRAARIGDYGELLTADGLAQIPAWSFWTVLNALDVFLWFVAILSGVGWWRWWRSRRERSTALFVLWIGVCFVVMIAAGYNWSSRYLLLLVPSVVIPAAFGLLQIRRNSWRAILMALVTFTNLWVAATWVRAEKDRWNETHQLARAIERDVPPGATIWSDDPYLTPFWAKRDVLALVSDSVVKPGDYIVLHDLYGALRRGQTVRTSLAEWVSQSPEILFWTSTEHTPQSGEVIDHNDLARAGSLRKLGPRAYWKKDTPITVEAVLLHLPAR